MDIHSWSRPDEVQVRHLELDLDVHFDRKILTGAATLHFDPTSHPELVLDTRDLEIHSVENAAGFEVGARDPILGAPLRIRLTPGCSWVRVNYSTSPNASGLQWLDPAQTAGKRMPFLYTQSQAIHARSWIPLQDSPAVRITFEGRVRTSNGLSAVMAAERAGNHFRMRHPVPSYLIALAAGDLEFRSLGERCGVFAEPSLVDAARREFADTEAMIRAVEEMFGPYRWGRYDLLVLPPSFPFGGMENPCLTFATPTILAGDKSLVALVAHELAHSWSGNLVTNATWSDFWLNEGFTVYIEGRIIEKVYGQDRYAMEATLARRELDREMESLPESDRVLYLPLAGRDPDDGCTLVPYQKGALLLRTLEREVGRDRFDAFLRSYFDHFAFRSISTAEFLNYFRTELSTTVPLDEWIYSPGIPASAAEPYSDAFTCVETAASRWRNGETIDTSRWSTQEWLHFLRVLEKPDLARLEAEFHLSRTGNAEILSQWLAMSIQAQFEPGLALLDSFLCSVGRRKFLKPLYSELLKTPEGAERARSIYRRARPGYHPIAQHTIDGLVFADR
ncbi:MAG: M1 family metallopeptidase [Acidobacteriia bacterium]|nr:M1 family metallopeptidase [Terriglobia bacterium]